MPEKWKVIEATDIVRDQWMRLARHACVRSDGSLVSPYYVIHGTNWVNITPVTPQGELFLINEYRHGYGSVLTGLPGGLIEKGEEPAEAAVRELIEETGLEPLVPLIETGRMVVNPSTHTNVGYSFLAIVSDKPLKTARAVEPDIEVLRADFISKLDEVIGGSWLCSGYDAASLLRAALNLKHVDLDDVRHLRLQVADYLGQVVNTLIPK